MDGSIARPRPMLALFLRLATALSLATMSMLVKLAQQRGAHLAELIFWRQAITVALVGGGLLLAGRLATVRTKRFGAHARRALLGLIGMFFVYGAVILLPLAEATTISFTTPMFAVLLSLVLFRERIGLYRWAAVAIGFAGVLIVLQPGGSGAIDPFGAAIGLIAALFVALISLQIQDLNTTESPWSIIFWFTALTAPIAALALPFVATAHDPATWGIILAMALCGALAQVLLTSSLRFGSAATIIVMDYTSLIWATIYGFAIFGRVPPSTLWIGAPLIILAGLVIFYRERQIARRKPAEPVS
ncbi:DMT family transporter [Alteriqipengyuania sp. WL0013]|uniref:DMT family transporter n=1 Tax=Alteriqipengyuania sp. WL0013 TaxID=3110773 RepID=UPI002BA91AB9|nr:DMT family transporter [Alteriqipengyuania sp. WL0013]MEB3415424.1 DMT family transporter [Alteriqipengyuania sp. WL0013]